MGTGSYGRKKRATAKKKGFKKYFLATKHRTRDVDQIQDDIAKGGVNFEYDPDLPGGGQFYCVETGRHFISADALAAHKKTKPYKKRLKELAEEQYTQAEAEAGAGIMKEKLPPIRRDADGNIINNPTFVPSAATTTSSSSSASAAAAPAAAPAPSTAAAST
ncbi:Zinc finger protein 593-like [Hondaea fermentalgiana]|uniref:Zinc finger protein 593-like n=1 Tax=Hondaea fermentalgiana TaxID=2315210 RepID=A0A2R5GFZ3_9STRA|nr:Zinc finger protein 593-like [Hondaea fermentalgiana]|eukprot:GBG27563.1 Zinc finger protein 593-like [Hondaea fermentalgiana]